MDVYNSYYYIFFILFIYIYSYKKSPIVQIKNNIKKKIKKTGCYISGQLIFYQKRLSAFVQLSKVYLLEGLI